MDRYHWLPGKAFGIGFLLLILLACMPLEAVTIEIASMRGFLYGTQPECTYDNWISHVSEGQVSSLNIYAPWDFQDNDFGDYLIPTSTQLAQWEQVIMCWLSLDMPGADTLIEQYQFPYETVIFQDVDSGRQLYILRENLNGDTDDNYLTSPDDDEIGSFDFSWGLYIYDPSASRPIIITVPHPCDDYPSPVMGLEAFQMLDARFLMIAGAGREVAYTPPYNSNNASISDPSRFEDHPFNVAYQRAADQIRSTTGKLEFSLQVHTYDWNKYGNDCSVMLSAGNGRQYPALPMRDASRSKNDLIHHTSYTVFPQGSVDNPSAITVDQYYCAYYHASVPIRYVKDGYDVLIPYNRNLPGAVENRQMLYTAPPNTYDVVAPFLHVEMDELPRFWQQSTSNWKWFYGWNQESGEWDIPQRWTRFIQFYKPWIEALNASLDAMLTLDDGTGPSNPDNLRVTNSVDNYADIAWDRAYSYDFDSYVLHLRYQNGDVVTTQTIDRHDVPNLAWQLQNSYTLIFPSETNVMYVSLQARDKHGNSSVYIPEIKVQKQASYPYGLEALTATPLDSGVQLDFEGAYANAMGFNVNRSSAGQSWTRVASWRDTPALLLNASSVYQYLDQGLANGCLYSYQISVEYPDGSELYYYLVVSAQPQRYTILKAQNLSNGNIDLLRIGMNINALDGYDDLDTVRSTSGLPSPALVTWDAAAEVYLSQDIKSPFDPSSTARMWRVKCYNSANNASIQISLDNTTLPHGWELQLRDTVTGKWHDLCQIPYTYPNTSGPWREFELWMGFLTPRVIIPEGSNITQYASEPLSMQWDVVTPARVQHLALKLVSPSDSLVVMDILPAVVESFSYIPPTEGICGARFVVEAYGLAGLISRAESSWQVDIIPLWMDIRHKAGYSLISIPSTGFSQSLSSALGYQALAWTQEQESLWQQASSLNATHGFLIRSPLPYQLSMPAELDYSVRTYPVIQGWNLIPNPHYRYINLSGLRFSNGDQTYTYSQLVTQGVMPPRAWVYTDSGWEDTDRVPPLHAFLLCYSGTSTPTLIIDPQLDDGSTFDRHELWGVTLSASDGFSSGDAIRIGVADTATAQLDAMYDLAKAPLFPLPHTRFVLTHNTPGGTTLDLQSSYRELFPDNNLVQKEWPVRLEIPVVHTIAFNLRSFGLPETYSVSIQIGNTSIEIPPGQTRWWDPPSAGIFDGIVTIRNHPAPNYRPTSESIGNVVIWPNPSKGSVNIDIGKHIGKFTSVTVYNIRGQKVAGLFHDAVIRANSQIAWDGNDSGGRAVAPGIYFIRVSDKAGSTNYKVLLTK